MKELSIMLPLILALAIPFSLASADVSVKTLSVQEQVWQQMNSLLHVKPSFSLELSKKQITEYSLIGAIALVVIITVSSSARSKSRKPMKK